MIDRKERNKEIRAMRKQYTLTQLAEKHQVSVERIRQILNPEKELYCKKHERRFKANGVCSLCYILRYYPNVLAMSGAGDNVIEDEIRLLSRKDRTIESVYMRSLLVKYLVEVREWSYSEIGRRLKRDHSAVASLYNKKL